MGVRAWAVGCCLVLMACAGGDGDAADDTADGTTSDGASPPSTLVEPTTTASPSTSDHDLDHRPDPDHPDRLALPRGHAGRRQVPPARGAGRLVGPVQRPALAAHRRAAGHGTGVGATTPSSSPRADRGARRSAAPATGATRRSGGTGTSCCTTSGEPGQAQPSLECPERDQAFVANLQRVEPFDVERQAIVAAYAACRERLEATGVDFDDYDSEASVRDLDAIREALGYDSWNLLGVSYGARLTLAAMRSAPEHVRSVILDSVYDVTAGGIGQTAVDAERAFQQLADGCAADADCAAAHPDLAATINAVNERYNANPIVVDVDLEDGGGPRTFVITGDDAIGGLFDALYDAALIPLLPSILEGLAAGDTGVVPELIRSGVGFATQFSDGMQAAVNCADNAGLDQSLDEQAIADPGRTALLVTDVICSEWPVEPTSDSFNEPVVSDIPALVLAGLYDPVTPPAGTEAVAGRLDNATFGLWPRSSAVGQERA